MGIGEQGQVMGLPLGRCQRHGTPLMSVSAGDAGGSTAFCLTCNAEFARANAANSPVAPVAEDPGPAAFEELIKRGPMGNQSSPDLQPMAKRSMPVAAPAGVSFEETVARAVAVLQTCQMPKDLKQFKIVQKAITNLNKILNPSEGE